MLSHPFQITTESSQAGCITLVIMFQYFYLTNFFWMFVEGEFDDSLKLSWGICLALIICRSLSIYSGRADVLQREYKLRYLRTDWLGLSGSLYFGLVHCQGIRIASGERSLQWCKSVIGLDVSTADNLFMITHVAGNWMHLDERISHWLDIQGARLIGDSR